MINQKLRILSLGWGVQSWAIAAMAATGKIAPVDAAIHSDTGWESSHTYAFAERWTPWLKERGVNVITVQAEKAKGQIKNEWEGTFIPAFTLGPGGNAGQLRRQCTHRWKIQPMRQEIRRMMEEADITLAPGVIEQLLGITIDEIRRAKDSDVRYIDHAYPLIDLGMSRSDCILWLRDEGLPIPPKSSCVFCPYHNRRAWEEMKREGGADWQTSLEADQLLRHQRPPYPLFVHPARIPLEEAVSIPEDSGMIQPDLFDLDDVSCDSGYCFL